MSGDVPTVFEQGKVVPGWRGPRPEGPQFQIDRAGLTLANHFRRPTPREVRGARQGRARFGLVVAPGGSGP